MSRTKTSLNIVEEKAAHLAVLIDADNASAKTIKDILEEVAKFGEATVKRIYGNFVGGGGDWKRVINEHAIKPMQQFAYTTGKNATDGFMIIDAMDLLYTERFDGFCLVSSDSDFTALAIRLKEQGLMVYGFGKQTTPEAFKNACSQFIYVENLSSDCQKIDIEKNKSEEFSAQQSKTETSTNINNQSLPLDVIRKIFEQSDSEWMTAAAFGSTWKRMHVDFDPRTYGAKRLTDLVKNNPSIFVHEFRKNPDSSHEHMYLKLKDSKS